EPQTVLGKLYSEPGVEQGRDILKDLARHPSTAAFVATKLARYFVADEPPPSLVDTLTRRFRDTDGDLKEVARALVRSPESGSPPRPKLKRPGEWILTAVRAAGYDAAPVDQLLMFHAMLGEPLWQPPAPNGFSDLEGASLASVAERLKIAKYFARHF